MWEIIVSFNSLKTTFHTFFQILKLKSNEKVTDIDTFSLMSRNFLRVLLFLLSFIVFLLLWPLGVRVKSLRQWVKVARHGTDRPTDRRSHTRHTSSLHHCPGRTERSLAAPLSTTTTFTSRQRCQHFRKSSTRVPILRFSYYVPFLSLCLYVSVWVCFECFLWLSGRFLNLIWHRK